MLQMKTKHSDEPPDSRWLYSSFVPVVEGSGLETATIVAIVANLICSIRCLLTLYDLAHENEVISGSGHKLHHQQLIHQRRKPHRTGQAGSFALGEMVIGSNVISLGIDTSNTDNWEQIIS